MMIAIWLDDAGFWKWLEKKSIERRETCLIFPLSNGTKFGMLTLVIGFALIMIMLCVLAPMLM
jgi:hypothetical protein